MTRSAALLLVQLPLLACTEPVLTKTIPSDDLESVVSTIDRRPEAGRIVSGHDITDLSKEQNAKGKEPEPPTRRGTASRITRKLSVKRTDDGFVAKLPNARTVPTPAYHEGRILTGGFGAYDMYAMDARTGSSEWGLRLSDDGPTDPACREGICVFNTYSCTIFAVEAATGKPLWSWYLGSPQLATPVIDGGVVYTSYPGSNGSSEARYVLGAFDLKTGKPSWRTWIDQEVNSTPVVHAGHVYVATKLGTLYELAAKDGAVISAQRNRIASPPVLTMDGVFFGHEEAPKENRMIETSAILIPALEVGAAPPTEMVKPKPRPLVAQHRLITIDNGMVVATNRHSGRRLWQAQPSGDAPADISAPLIYAGKSILMATRSGNVVRMEPDTGEVSETFHLGEGAIASQPIAVDGWIYAGTMAGSIVGFDTHESSLTGWEMLGGTPDRRGAVNLEEK
jgi:outer membrane protein assembly factor BamB